MKDFDRPRFLRVYTWAFFAVLFLPIVLVVLFSFNSQRSLQRFTGFSLEWYQRFLENESLTSSLRASLEIATVTMVVGTLLGTLLAYGLVRARTRWVGSANVLMLVPLVTPEIVAGVSALLLFTQLGVRLSLLTIMLAHITFSISYVTVVVRARLASIHPEIEQAAMDLGASRLQTVRLVILPALWPAILAAGLLTFALSFDDFVLSFFTTGESPQPLPVRIWSAIRFGVTPTINAIGTLMLTISVLAIGLAIWLPRLVGPQGERDRRAAGEGGRVSEAVRFEGVTKRFGAATAVEDLNLTIAAGEFFSLLGPSGCGKTTTLRMVAGFEQPTEGEVFLEGEPVATVPPFKRNVNTVFQSYALFEHLDVRNNVAFGLKRRKVAAPEIETRVAEALELVQLRGRETARPNELSGGQRQRVALARALVNRPAVLLLDEPLGALDLKLRKQMQVELKSIQREVGITFLYVTHDQEEALAMSDRIAVMDTGVVVQCGTPEDVYERPAKPFVAGFIGISNLMEGTAEDGGVRLRTGALCAVALPEGCAPGTEVQLSVRPEKIWLDEHEDGMVKLSGTVAERVYVGTTTQVIIDLGPGTRVVALEQNTHVSHSGDRWEIGHPITVAWRPEHSLVLR